MPVTLDALSQDALALPPDQRMTLAHRLLSSVEPSAAAATDAAWDAEISGRIARFDAGEVQTVPAQEVFASLRAIVASK